MSLQVFPDKDSVASDSFASELIEYLFQNEEKLSLDNSCIFYDFPMYRNDDGGILRANVLLVSPRRGVVLFGSSSARNADVKELQKDISVIDDVFANIFARFIKQKDLKRNRTSLNFNFTSIIIAENYTGEISEEWDVVSVLHGIDGLILNIADEMTNGVYEKILSVLDGGPGLVKSKSRLDVKPGSKGDLANKIEAEITRFDNKQRHGYMLPMSGVQRIRGLAGSGKTVILSMKAALTHLEFPDATILFTFHTKSLYQLVQKLITRFYRQYSDGVPDFENRIKILHSWGGVSANGVYYQACLDNNVTPLTFPEAKQISSDPFDGVCSDFLRKISNPLVTYDYAFIDEGQDFSKSFLQLVVKMTRSNRVVWAYDELQSIFATDVPLLTDIVSEDEIAADTILYKCYRNPREILVCAHALGFGIYGKEIVQMLETKERWESAGYEIVEGTFSPGHKIVIERPVENTLTSISNSYTIDEIIKFKAFEEVDEEISYCVERVKEDLLQGLRPDDILIISIDDRNAKLYLSRLEKAFRDADIRANNIHADIYSVVDFEKEGMVTLSTINKAKGNEAYSVHVLGIDAVFNLPTKTQRNKIFTALTRAKGWVSISGIGESAQDFGVELAKAKQKFPILEFDYPTEAQWAVIRDDMHREKMLDKKAEREFEELFKKLGPEKFLAMVEQKQTKSKWRP
ncbi:ATP-binding domain-containing protein [uncultured Desulfovibrio sp.]|uniref:DEAD/DEAH box helicase n=1 Tax=uncultured Desulfovibrio sp. TaxID=167968 RepID=UPI0028045390|nr:ATP-binding domain-containing protein [uncultured Desulfovibrio sp.]